MKKWLLVMVCGIGMAAAANSPRVDQAIKEFDAHVAQLRAEFARKPANSDDIEWVKAKLAHMVEVDQYFRTYQEKIGLHTFTSAEQQAYFNHQYQLDIDGHNLAELKPLLDKYGWFGIGKFGSNADRDAWLLVQHADQDIEFQKKVLAALEPLAKTGETNLKNYAYLFDRVAVNLRQPDKRGLQRYGTQGRCIGPGTWAPFPVEDPESLDARRAEVGLMPEAEYQKFFKDVCRESTEETIRKAREAAAKATTP